MTDDQFTEDHYVRALVEGEITDEAWDRLADDGGLSSSTKREGRTEITFDWSCGCADCPAPPADAAEAVDRVVTALRQEGLVIVDHPSVGDYRIDFPEDDLNPPAPGASATADSARDAARPGGEGPSDVPRREGGQ